VIVGPVRTALKRGWKVELYAWEDGLSEFFFWDANHRVVEFFQGRAWRKEFGVGSEWERNGAFRIIGMEQFAAYLVNQGGEPSTLG